jgi:ribonuclease E
MRQLVISEQDNVAALMENGKAIDFFISKNEYSVGDIYAVQVENIMPSINAVFVKIADGQMGFLHANDIAGRGHLETRLSPGQRLLVQIVKEPTGNKGPRVNPAISLPGRYFVVTTENQSIAISRRIGDNTERDRLRSIANLMKPEELGVVIRTEAAGRTQEELEEDFLTIWEKWKNVVDKYDRSEGYCPIFKDTDFLYSTLRDAFNSSVDEICVSSVQSKYRCQEYLKTWTGREVEVKVFEGSDLMVKTDVLKELRGCLSNRANLPSGGYVIIQGMEALTAIDINSGKFTSSTTLRETVRRTNMEAAVEIARQMRLRNIGGMIIIDFIDMADRADRIAVMEVLENAVKSDKAKPQIGQLSDLCLVEITRKRSGQAIAEIFGETCSHCNGSGVIFNLKDDGSKNNRHNSRPQHSHSRPQGNSNYRNDRNDRNDRSDRPERIHDRSERPNDRSERPSSNDRNNNPNRNDRNNNPNRNDRNNNPNRNDRNNNNNRNDRNNNNRNQQQRPKREPQDAGLAVVAKEDLLVDTSVSSKSIDAGFDTPVVSEATKSKSFGASFLSEDIGAVD